MSIMYKRSIFGTSAVLALLGASLGMTMASSSAPDDADNSVRIGVYQPQVAFQGYRGAQEMTTQMQELQQQMQQAQQQGDQQRAMEIQMRMQELQSQVVEKFYADVERAMPDVAEKADVQVVAVEVIYSDPSLDEPRDITTDLVDALRNGDDEEAAPEQPQQPW